MGRVSGGSGIRLACLLLASLAAPTAATLTKIDNVDPTSLGGVLGMGSLGVDQGDYFGTPLSVPSNTGFTDVTLRAEMGDPKRFLLLQQNVNSWEGGLPPFMYNVYNLGDSLLRLEFNPPIFAFATYIEVDVSDHCFHVSNFAAHDLIEAFMQPYNSNIAFTANITAYDSSTNLIGEVLHSDTTVTFGNYNITPVGVRSSTPITSIFIQMTDPTLNAFTIGTLYFTPGKPHSCSPQRVGWTS
jgi:hypothetical protein